MRTTGSAKAVRTAAVPAHAGIEGRGTTESIPGWRPGSLCLTEKTIDVRRGASRGKRACRRTVAQAVPERTFTLGKTLRDGGGSHRRSRLVKQSH